jgi:transposase IS66 family protein
MAERPVPEELARLDLASIADVGARQAIRALLNLVEELAAENRALRTELARVKDENARLKGGAGRPRIPPGKAGGSTDYSSEVERRPAPKPWQKRGKQDRLRIDRTERLPVDPATLPADAVFKGYETVVVQDLVLRTDTVAFEHEVWYSPSERRSYRAQRPVGYEGTVGPHLRALVLTLAYACGMSERKILELVRSTGLVLSAGTLSNLLTGGRAAFTDEARDVLRAGLASTPYQHLDDTSTRVDGTGWYCHIVCNALYTAYRTTPGKDRRTIVEVLRGGRPPASRYDHEAERHLAFLGLSAAAQARVRAVLPRDQEVDETTLTRLLDGPLAGLGPRQREQVREALAVAAYLADPDWPVVRTLVCDDAPQFRAITEELALCWVHEGRHYKQLAPCLPQPRAALAGILDRFWTYYRDLLAYRDHPTPDERARLDACFDALFGTVTGYHDLDRRLALTRDKKPELLLVLEHPELPLHNNPAELGARQRVRKRDVSFGPRSPAGAAAWDTFMTLAATTRKLGLDFASYLTDRFTHAGQIPPLADLITARAAQFAGSPA